MRVVVMIRYLKTLIENLPDRFLIHGEALPVHCALHGRNGAAAILWALIAEGLHSHRRACGACPSSKFSGQLSVWFERASSPSDWCSSRCFEVVVPPILPMMLDTFMKEVVPILQKRGLFRTAYAGETLQAHYGLAEPETQFS